MTREDSALTEMVVHPPVLRRTMGRFTTGVAVVTTESRSGPHGMTVNSLTSVSLEPPLVLVSLAAGARTTEAISECGRFAISVLATRQDAIATRFARSGADHFEGLPLEYGPHAVPVVPDALAHVECLLDQEMAAGDHVLLLGAVIDACDRDGEPLVFHAGQFGEFAGRGDQPVPWFF